MWRLEITQRQSRKSRPLTHPVHKRTHFSAYLVWVRKMAMGTIHLRKLDEWEFQTDSVDRRVFLFLGRGVSKLTFGAKAQRLHPKDSLFAPYAFAKTPKLYGGIFKFFGRRRVTFYGCFRSSYWNSEFSSVGRVVFARLLSNQCTKKQSTRTITETMCLHHRWYV